MIRAQIQKPKDSYQSLDEIADEADQRGIHWHEAESTKADLESLLADIDDLLEENAEAFVKAYVQRGGE